MPRLSKKKRGGFKRTKKGGMKPMTTTFRQPTSNLKKTTYLPYRENTSKLSTYDERNKFVNELRNIMNDYSDKIISLTAGELCVKTSNNANYPGFTCEHDDDKKEKIKVKIKNLLEPIIDELEQEKEYPGFEN